MKTHEFSIIASGLDPRADDFETRLYDAGCDDALVAFQKGRIIIDFSREAEFVQDAISSAIEDVRRIGAKVEHVEPDPLVSLSDIAQRSGLTRAAVYNYAKGDRRGDFPPPVARVTTGNPLWDWAEVAGWMLQQGIIAYEVWIQAVFLRDTNAHLGKETPDSHPPKERERA